MPEEIPGSASHRVQRRGKRSLIRAAAALALLLGGLTLAAAALLDSAWLQGRLATQEGLTISWETSRPGWGSLAVTALVIERDDPDLPLALEVETARIALDLRELLRGQLMIRSLEASGLERLEVAEYRLDGGGRLTIVGLDLARHRVGVERLTLALEEARISRDGLALVEEISLAADLSATPFDPGAHHGQAAMRFVSGRLALGARADAWDLFNPYLAELEWLDLAGRGSLTGTLRLAEGRLGPGSRLTLEAPELAVSLHEAALLAGSGDAEETPSWARPEALYRLQGRGSVVLEVDEDARLAVTLADLSMREGADPAALLTGRHFHLTAPLPTDLAAPPTPPDSAELRWTGATLPDIAALQRFLPPGSSLALEGGSADLDGALRYAHGRLNGHFVLAGDGVALRFRDQALQGEARLDLALRMLDPQTRRLDLSGSRLALAAEARGAAADQPLGTLLVAREARFSDLHDPAGRRGHLVIEGMVDRLGFLDAFLPEAHGVTLRGQGRFAADLRLSGDRLLPESRLRLDADALAVGFLDYRAEGRGELRALIDGSADSPGARLTLSLPRFALRRSDLHRPDLHRSDPHRSDLHKKPEASPGAAQARAWLAGRHLRLETHTPRFSLDPAALNIADVTTRVSLPIVEVPDLGLYAAYLPAQAGIGLEGGSASLEAELELIGMRARGDLLLQAFDTRLTLVDQQLRGDLRLEARLREGDLAARRFDASGSLLRLDNISRRDADGQGEAGWWAHLALEEGRLLWAEPLAVEARLGLAMRDSGLLARLFLADARERDWLGRLLTVRGVEGQARLDMDADGIRVSEARLDGGPLTLLAGLHFHAERLDGSLYGRLGRLAVGVELEEGERTLRFWQPRRWFDGGSAGAPPVLEETTPEAFREALTPR